MSEATARKRLVGYTFDCFCCFRVITSGITYSSSLPAREVVPNHTTRLFSPVYGPPESPFNGDCTRGGRKAIHEGQNPKAHTVISILYGSYKGTVQRVPEWRRRRRCGRIGLVVVLVLMAVIRRLTVTVFGAVLVQIKLLLVVRHRRCRRGAPSASRCRRYVTKVRGTHRRVMCWHGIQISSLSVFLLLHPVRHLDWQWSVVRQDLCGYVDTDEWWPILCFFFCRGGSSTPFPNHVRIFFCTSPTWPRINHNPSKTTPLCVLRLSVAGCAKCTAQLNVHIWTDGGPPFHIQRRPIGCAPSAAPQWILASAVERFSFFIKLLSKPRCVPLQPFIPYPPSFRIYCTWPVFSLLSP